MSLKELQSIKFDFVAHDNSSQLQGKDDPSTPRPWNLIEEIKAYGGADKHLLDIGCGTAFKLVPLAAFFKEIVGLDISQSMLNAARTIINTSGVKNIRLIEGSGYTLPFEDQAFDVVTCMLSRWSPKEIHRVLKPQGVAIIEHIGCEDKKELKILFGKDEKGWRGRFIKEQLSEYLAHYWSVFEEFFGEIHLKNGYWNTFYTEQGLLELLKYTPMVRNFDEVADKAIVQKAITLFTTPHGIKLKQNRILIYAKKR